MPGRGTPLVENKVYHILSKSIAGFRIFRSHKDYKRMRETLKYYRTKAPLRYSTYLEIKKIKNKRKIPERNPNKDEKLVEVIAYCLMPTHIHLILKQCCKNGISIYMGRVLNSYTRYFNTKIKRKGPLWEGRFKSIEIETDEQLYHLTRYIHLNPVTGHIVERPEEWKFSSYREFLGEEEELCDFLQFFEIDPEEYEKFVLSRIEYQRELARIKRLFIE